MSGSAVGVMLIPPISFLWSIVVSKHHEQDERISADANNFKNKSQHHILKIKKIMKENKKATIRVCVTKHAMIFHRAL